MRIFFHIKSRFVEKLFYAVLVSKKIAFKVAIHAVINTALAVVVHSRRLEKILPHTPTSEWKTMEKVPYVLMFPCSFPLSLQGKKQTNVLFEAM